ncbi:MAG: hypothetical protein WCB20_11955, partial [Chthoniobacterales bacterium]
MLPINAAVASQLEAQITRYLASIRTCHIQHDFFENPRKICNTCDRHSVPCRAMIFPLGVQFHEAQRLLVWRPRGVLNQEVISDIVAVLNELEVELHGPFNRFSDTSGVDQIDLNYEYIIGVSTYRRLAYGHHPPIKSAILAINQTLINYANLHRLVTAGSP